jgi:ribonucleoside-diphosphate reductase alpha chain
VENPRTKQRYLLPRRIDIAGYTINDLHKLTGKPPRPAGRTGQFYTVSDIWKMIVKCAHKTGEPGVAFIDRINRDNPTPSLGRIEATNPCGEQPLLPYEACTLGSINLVKFVTLDQPKAEMNWPALAETVKLAVRFLDNIIDVCDYPVRDTIRLAQANRKIGLSVMGFADCLFLLGIPYDSQQGIKFGETVMEFINKNARQAGNTLADLRGPFPNWNDSIWRTEKNRKVRNASITCIAPTGTISIIADCSCGIEPAYSLVFVRRILNGSKLLQIDPIFRQTAEKGGFYSKKLEKHIAKTGSIQKIPQIPPKIRKVFKCAYDIKPQWHIRMQAAFQRHCDAAVSKTINFPQKATVAAVDKAYKLAYRLGCKGITIYRRRSRVREPMSLY